MIRYALACEKGHSFESWFQNSAAYDKQAKRALVTCPVCGSAKVEKAIMAPSLASGSALVEPTMPQSPGSVARTAGSDAAAAPAARASGRRSRRRARSP